MATARLMVFASAVALLGCDAESPAAFDGGGFDLPSADLDGTDLFAPPEDPSDAGVSAPLDATPPPVAPPKDAGAPPAGGGDPPVVHAPPGTLTGVTVLLSGQEVLDVSTDQGGGVWAVTRYKVYYFPPGQKTPYGYDQASGLARGMTQWTDTWFDPGTYPVTFASVAGATAGTAMIGNLGAIADRLQVNPSTGAVVRLENLEVTSAQEKDPVERQEHLKRVVAAFRIVVDLNGAWNGTAYLGGYHGIYALHGMVSDCQCLAFEEHMHYVTDTFLSGSWVRGLALSPVGDLWAGDRDRVTHLIQRSMGPYTGLSDGSFDVAVDVFPGVQDQVIGLAVDGADGVWVASETSGLAYLPPVTRAPLHWSSAVGLPQNRLRGLALDGAGDLWLGTRSAGVARLHPSTGAFTYYTTASGLPSSAIRAIHFDRLSGGGKLYIATETGIAVFSP